MKAAISALVVLILLALVGVWTLGDELKPSSGVSAGAVEVPAEPEVSSVGAVPAIDASSQRQPGSTLTSGSSSDPVGEAPSDVAWPVALEVDEPPIEIPAGTVLMGRVVDPSGKPAPYATCFFTLESGMVIDASMELDSYGRFALGINQPGELSFHLETAGLGRSADLSAVLVENEATDVGTIQLAGGGEIRGQVRLADGTLLPGVDIRGMLTNPAPGPGSRDASCRSEDDGSFVLSGLASGAFVFTVKRKADLPVLGQASFRAGEQDAVLVVEAPLVRISLPPIDGEPVAIHSVGLSPAGKATPGQRGYRGASGRSWSRGVPYCVRVVPVGAHVLVEGSDGAGKRFSSILDGDMASGFHQVVLREDGAQLGRVRLMVPLGSDLGGGDILVSVSRDDTPILGIQKDVSAATDAVQYLELVDLRSGSYRLRVRVRDPWVLLAEEYFLFDLAGGGAEDITLEPIQCGKIDLSVGVDVPVNDAAEGLERASVEVWGPADSDWHTVSWAAKHRSGPKVAMDSTVAQSPLLAPGRYLLRVSADGCETVEAAVVVLEGEAVELDLSLRRGR